MPFVHIEYVGTATNEQKQRLMTRVSDAVAEELNKDKNKVYVILNEIKEDNIAVGGVQRSNKSHK